MFIKQIELENFRNISRATLDLCPAVNIMYGDNAQGKTNFLEAAAIVLGKNFRKIRPCEVFPFDAPADETARVRLLYESETLPGKINEIVYELRKGASRISVNGLPLKKAESLYGEYKFVVFIPDNLGIIKGYPQGRRGYIDNIAVMQNKVHRKFAADYKKALTQRCFACSRGGNADKSLLDSWNDVLIKQGINLTYGRLKYLCLIKGYAREIYRELSGGEELDIHYNSSIFGENLSYDGFVCKIADKNSLYDEYCRKLHAVNFSGKSENTLALITPGAHKDDIVFYINGRECRGYASQGQLRSVAVSLKLAEARVIREFNRENPVVLLDEVLGELDSGRREYVIKHFVDSQVIITSCNKNDFMQLPNVKMWSVSNGVFTLGE